MTWSRADYARLSRQGRRTSYCGHWSLVQYPSQGVTARGAPRGCLRSGRCPRRIRLPHRRWTKVQLLWRDPFRSVRAVSQDRPIVALADDEEPVLALDRLT